ncbi:MAG: hypothetical protein V4557_12755 [Bacteroidota bacterium]
MKHFLIVYEDIQAAEQLKQLLLEQFVGSDPHDGVTVHTVQSAGAVHHVLLSFPVSIAFIGVGLWDHTVFRRIGQVPTLVILCNPREFMKEEMLGQINYLKQPFTAKDIILLKIRMPKLVSINSTDFMFLKCDRRWRKLMFEEIEMIERKDTMYLMFHTRVGNFLVLGSMENWLKRLPSELFQRVADGLVLPIAEVPNIAGDLYFFKGREINLSFRFSRKVKRDARKLKHAQ